MYNELYHHGILGQKWGVRRFQQKNGKLTAAGKKRYEDSDSEEKKPKEDTRSIAEKTKALQDETNYINAKLANEDAQRRYAAAHAKGKSAVQQAFENAAKKAAGELATKTTSAISNAVAEEIKKKVSPKSEAQKALEAMEKETKALKAQYENADYKQKLEDLRRNSEYNKLKNEYDTANTKQQMADLRAKQFDGSEELRTKNERLNVESSIATNEAKIAKQRYDKYTKENDLREAYEKRLKTPEPTYNQSDIDELRRRYGY